MPEDLLVKTSLIGPEGYVRDRLRALADSGVTRSPSARSRAATRTGCG